MNTILVALSQICGLYLVVCAVLLAFFGWLAICNSEPDPDEEE